MITYLSQLFDYLLEKQQYQKEVRNVTHVVKELIYKKRGIQLIFTCELTEWAFDFELRFSDDRGEHSVTEQKGQRALHYQNVGIDMLYESVFEYSNEVWSKDVFQREKERLLHKRYGMGRAEKLFKETAALYRALLEPAINNIERCVNEEGETGMRI